MNRQALFWIIWVLSIGLLIACEAEPDTAERDEDGTRTLYVFGDSWAAQIDEGPIENELEQRGFADAVTHVPFGIGGSTMAQWANDDDGIMSELLDMIENDPNSDPIVFFMLSGNDVLGGGSIEDVAQHFRDVLNQLEGTRDDLQIVFALYDILNPAIEPEQCNGIFEGAFGTTDVVELNTYWTGIATEAAQITADYDRVTFVNTYGSLQGNPGNPDLNSWSPVEYLADCIHLTDAGYDLYLDPVFEEGISPILENG